MLETSLSTTANPPDSPNRAVSLARKVSLDVYEWEPGAVWRQPLAAGGSVCLQCTEGCLWITNENDQQDHILLPGDSLTLNGPGLAVVEAITTSCVRYHLISSEAA